MSVHSVSTSPLGNILVASQDEGFCTSLKGILEGEGYGVYICHTFEELSTLEHHNLRIVIMDITDNLPSGLHTIEFIKQSPTGTNIPILVAADYPSSDAIVSALNMGASDYIVKPFSARELLNSIKSIAL